MKRCRLHGPWLSALIGLALSSAAPQTTRADLIINGGFEAGFTGWTRADQVGSEGTFFLQSGTTSPVNGDPVPAPPGGIRAAMTDAQGPGSHVLFQDFVVPALPIGISHLRFDLFIGNRAASFVNPSPPSLDFSTPALNQQARVDILRAGTDPFSVSASDVLLNAYQTKPGDPLISGYNTIDVDVTSLLAANAGNTLRLRFAEVDNLFTFQLGVDNVNVNADVTVVPEPSSLILCAVGTLVALGFYGRRYRPPVVA